MSAAPDDRVPDPLGAALRLLESGHSREAADAFGRLLLQDPGHAPARRGLEQARAALAEEARLLDSVLDDARVAARAGERARAVRLLEDVIRGGGDRDRAAELLERLTQRSGRLDVGAALPPLPGSDGALRPRAHRGWSRRVFIASWMVVFALLAGGLAWSWDELVARLVAKPAPHARSLGGAR